MRGALLLPPLLLLLLPAALAGAQPVAPAAPHPPAAAAPASAEAAAAASPAPAAAASPLGQLQQTSRAWIGRGREDRAALAYEKLLRSRPDHAEALAELTVQAAAAGQLERAGSYLGRLEQAHPRDPRLASLRSIVRRVAGRFGPLLQQARAASAAGRRDEAVARYRQAFGGVAPTTLLGLEFYQTCAGTAAGWGEARTGLEQLASLHPGMRQVQLALALHLTYRPQARPEGIARLAELARSPEVAVEALKGWRQALLWQHDGPEEAEQLQAYLTANGDDAELRERLGALRAQAGQQRAQAGQGSSVQAGFSALEAQDVAGAERAFAQARAAGEDVQTLVGLAVVALRKEDFLRAQTLLRQVARRAPGRPELWSRSLQSAEFWLLLRRGEGFAAAGKDAEAQADFAAAAARSPEDAPHAELAQANLLLQRRRYAEAEAPLRRLLTAQGRHADGLRALVEVLLHTGRGEEALTVNAQLRELEPAKAYAEGSLQAELLRGEAATRRRSGDLAAARALLVRAAQAAPESDWVQLDLADVLLELGEPQPAGRAVAEVLARQGTLPEALLAQARIDERQGRFKEGLKRLAGLPTDRGPLAPATLQLRDRLQVRAESLEAVGRFFVGRPLAARHQLNQLEQRVADRPELQGLVALAWAEIGQYDHALTLVNEAMLRSPDDGPDLRLQLTTILFKSGDQAGFLAAARELAADPRLSLIQQQGLTRLRVAEAVRRVDRLRERGETEPAFAYLEPLLAEFPDEPELNLALGRLLYAAREYAEADAAFGRVLQARLGDPEALQGQVLDALATDDRGRARTLVEQGLAQRPDEPRMHLLAGRLALMTDDKLAAMQAFRRAQLLATPRPLLTRWGGAVAEATPATDLGPGEEGGEVARGGRGAGRGAPGGGGSPGSWGAGGLAARGITLSGGAGGELGNAVFSGPARHHELRQEIEREIEALRADSSISVHGGAQLRSRTGEAGLQSLSELQLPTTLAVPTLVGTLRLTTTPTFLTAGSLALDGANVTRFGTLALHPLGQPGSTLDGSQSAAALELSFERRGLRLELGTTPLGFPLATGVGAARWQGSFGRLGLALEASRRAVTESLLSYAGAEDPGSGARWGGVVAQGGRLDLGYLEETVTFYLFTAYHQLVGENVADNRRAQGGFGLRWRLYDWSGTSFTTGLLASGMAFDRNLGGFTFGQGGYFSPQQFAHLGLPVAWHGERGQMSWQLDLQPGLNWYHLDQSPYYPTDPALQGALAGRIDPEGRPLHTVYPELSSSGFAFDGELALSRPLGGQIDVGARAGVHTGEDYREVTATAFVAFRFARRTAQGGPSRTGSELSLLR